MPSWHYGTNQFLNSGPSRQILNGCQPTWHCCNKSGIQSILQKGYVQRSHTGRLPKWYVFPRMMRHPRSSSCCEVRPFRVPCVPTGINTGVSTMACGNTILQALAFETEHSAAILKLNACFALPTAICLCLHYIQRMCRMYRLKTSIMPKTESEAHNIDITTGILTSESSLNWWY